MDTTIKLYHIINMIQVTHIETDLIIVLSF